ncbi:MAG: hypothetical protein QNJ41_14575 [Xenococcaceae cyanobacterium MO_188.B32]|nr:hypothetical protein [Xenococcaceae cyanobacterium MO_188.B32]
MKTLLISSLILLCGFTTAAYADCSCMEENTQQVVKLVHMFVNLMEHGRELHNSQINF